MNGDQAGPARQAEAFHDFIRAVQRLLAGAGLFIVGLMIGFAMAAWMRGLGTARADAAPGPATILTFAAEIDGSDRFDFTPDAVTHAHGRWSPPRNVFLNGEPWADLSQSPAGWVALPRDLERAGATLVSRQGRDVVVLEPTPEGFTLYFADTQIGAGPYEATISIPRR